MQVVGPVNVVATRVPRIQIDASQVHQPQQGSQMLNHREADHVAGPMLDRADRDRSGRGDGARFMKKKSPAMPFG